MITARPLSPREQSEADGLLRDSERPLFWSQPPADQRHALDGARMVLAAAPGRRDLARAALLHDVGKRHARLGAIGRVAATLAAAVKRDRGRFELYRRHPELAAGELEAAGAEDLVVTFARHHHGDRPASVDPDAWELLVGADTA